MDIRFKKISGRYAFDILDEDSKIIYASDIYYFLTPHVKSSYKYAWEACRDSHKLLFHRPYHLFAARDDMTIPIITDISAEQMLVNHYLKIYEGLKEQAQGAGSDKKERDFAYKSIKIIEGELKKILETLTDDKSKRSIRIILSRFKKLLRKYFQQEERKKEKESINIASSQIIFKKAGEKIDIGVKKDLIEDYAQKICQVIQNKHPDAYYAISSDKIKIIDENNSCILEASINDDLNIENIIPCGSLRKIYPFHSNYFYQKYWKPIVEAIGYFVTINPHILIASDATTLPDVPKDRNNFCIKGWNIEDKKEQSIEIAFNNGSWSINLAHSQTKMASQNPSQYNEKDYLEAIVECIDPKLESIYNRIGTVVQVIPHIDIIEIDVDFGRGLGIIRLTEKQIQIV